MLARNLLARATSSFAPPALGVIGQAFDEAWAEIAGRYSGAQQIEAARLKLATILLTLATNDSRDVDGLKQAALAQLAKEG
jgi:hypothetical protein